MAGFVEQSPIQRESNANWVNNVIIPKLYEHNERFPLPRALQVLYRANTLGIRDSDFQQQYKQWIDENGGDKDKSGRVTFMPPLRGHISRTLKAIGDESALRSFSPQKLKEFKAVQLTITKHIYNYEVVYIPPAQRVDELADTLSHSTEVLLKQAENFQQALPVISDFVLLFDALHPYIDGTGRTMRAASNYMAYPFGYQFNYPLRDGHLDSRSTIVNTIQSFEYNILREEGYNFPIFREGSLIDEHRKQIDSSINYEKLSDSFEQIMLQRRENKRLLPFYRQMDAALEKIAVPRIK